MAAVALAHMCRSLLAQRPPLTQLVLTTLRRGLAAQGPRETPILNHTRAPYGWWEGNGAEAGVHNLRAERINEDMIGKRFKVHTGNRHIVVAVRSEMVGHKFGEFAPTRKRPPQKEKKKVQNKKR